MFKTLNVIVAASLLTGLFASGAAKGQAPTEDAASRKPKAATVQGEADAQEQVDLEPEPRVAKPTRVQAPKKVVESGVADQAAICEPAQGRPIFITPGETFIFVMRLTSEVTGDVGFFLRHAVEPGIRYTLRPTTPPSYSDEYCTLVLAVPQATTPGLYDLEVKTDRSALASRRSVKVVDEFKTKFRFVHLSNMNIGDLTAPDFDDMLSREINLLAPEFIIATGDYTEWARARDDASSWPRVLKFFEQFNAPVYMLCGAHDHEASFTKYVASKPIGTIDYGNYHGLLLLDHPGNPIEQDYNQIQWVETDLKRNRQKTFNFIACNSDELGLIDVWREKGNLSDFIKEHKIKFFLTGGSTDWDFKEFADKLDGLDGVQLIRTHQSSTSLRDRATGFSHYRVIDVNGDKIEYTYRDDNSAEKLQYSVPTGRLRAFYDSPNDGKASKLAVTVQNPLNQGFADAHVWLRIAKNGSEEPVVAPGRLIRTLDVGDYWACEVAIDLPEKGAVRVVAATDADSVPPELPIDVELEGPRELSFKPETTDFGLSYFASPATVNVKLTSRARTKLTCWPVFRLNGGQLTPDPKACPRLPITLEPGKTLTVPLVMQVRRVSPGDHKLQVHFLEDPLCRLHTFDVNMTQADEVAKADSQ